VVAEVFDQPSGARAWGAVRAVVDGSPGRADGRGLPVGERGVEEDGADLAGVGPAGGQEEAACSPVGEDAGGALGKGRGGAEGDVERGREVAVGDRRRVLGGVSRRVTSRMV